MLSDISQSQAAISHGSRELSVKRRWDRGILEGYNVLGKKPVLFVVVLFSESFHSAAETRSRVFPNGCAQSIESLEHSRDGS
jgi:hypothetical protein